MNFSEVIIVGGGLAGLISAIHLRKLNHQVILFESQFYPRHKVCGEYISNEVRPYLKSLGIPLKDWGIQEINKFRFTTNNGKSVTSSLKMGGFGISRYQLDARLAEMAVEIGVEIIHQKVNDIQYNQDVFTITTDTQDLYSSTICIGAHGKRSTIDKNLERNFMNERTPWIGIKAHYEYDLDKEEVALHHFEGGYCGLSKVEEGRVNACYLIHQSLFNQFKSIDEVQKNVLSKNPYLADFFSSAKPLFEKPLAISQIYFGERPSVENHILMVGDAGGMIYPLAGNGMAIAMHSAKLASEAVHQFLNGFFKRDEMEAHYFKQRKAFFVDRIRKGTIIQKLLENSTLSNRIMNVLPYFPFILPIIIRQTHGKYILPFVLKE